MTFKLQRIQTKKEEFTDGIHLIMGATPEIIEDLKTCGDLKTDTTKFIQWQNDHKNPAENIQKIEEKLTKEPFAILKMVL